MKKYNKLQIRINNKFLLKNKIKDVIRNNILQIIYKVQTIYRFIKYFFTNFKNTFELVEVSIINTGLDFCAL